ncbi:MAG: Asp-tRNA(Asn)/Glu-tRNA(Gln) amidotransferase subunit GatC [Eubacteriaceae bacterium]
MKISKEEVAYVAGLARLSFNEEETEKLQEELSSVLDYVAALEKLDTTDVKPTEHVLELVNVLRPDVVGETLPIEKVLANAPESESNAFKVPRVIE